MLLLCDGLSDLLGDPMPLGSLHQGASAAAMVLFVVVVVVIVAMLMQRHTCCHHLKSSLWTYPQSFKASIVCLNDPKCHLYPDPCLVIFSLFPCLWVMVGGHQTPQTWVGRQYTLWTIERNCHNTAWCVQYRVVVVLPCSNLWLDSQNMWELCTEPGHLPSRLVTIKWWSHVIEDFRPFYNTSIVRKSPPNVSSIVLNISVKDKKISLHVRSNIWTLMLWNNFRFR